MKILSKFISITVIMVFLGACASGKKPYPLDTCIVSDNDLGSMGDAISYNHEGQEVKFCCKPCIKKFKRSPEKYLIKLN